MPPDNLPYPLLRKEGKNGRYKKFLPLRNILPLTKGELEGVDTLYPGG